MIYYALLLFFVFDYLRPGNYIPGLDVLKLNALVPLTAIAGTVALKTPVSNRQFFSETNTKLMGVLLGLLIVSTIFAPVTMTAYTVTKNVFAYMLVYWVIVRQVGDVRRLKGLFITITLVHLAVAALNPQLFTNPDSRVGINSGAFLGDGNDFSLSVNLCIPLCLFLFFESRRKLGKLIWVLVLLTLVLGVVATKSRGGALALGAIGLYYWLKSERKVMMAALGTATVVVVLLTAPPLWFERMSTITDTEESSAQGRILAWKAGFQMALGSPIIGVGPGHFPMAYGTAAVSRWVTAHSIYFLLLGELGFPGLILLLVLIGWNLLANQRLQKEVRRLPRDEALTASNVLTATSASLVGFAVGGAFLSAAYYPHLYVLSGMLVAARHLVRVRIAARQGAGEELLAAPAAAATRPVPRPGAISPEWRPRAVLGGGQVRQHRA